MIANAFKNWMPDELFLRLQHRRKIGRFPSLANPETFNEKMLRRSLNPDARFTDLADKLIVRDFVRRVIGEEHLIPLLKASELFTEEDFEALPDSFVMKANHGSGFVKIVRDKAETSYQELRTLADRWLATDFSRTGRERHYRAIQPRLLFEALLLDEQGNIPADFKIHCFNPEEGPSKLFVLLISDRYTGHPRGDFFDESWNHLDIRIGHYPRSATPCERPANLDAILAKAKALSASFDYVRVDLYAPDCKIFFGEMTFTPGGGLYPLFPDSVDYQWGQMLQAAPLLSTPKMSTRTIG